MKLNYITLMVRNMERSLAFYQELAGLHLVRRLTPGPGEIAFLANGAGETMLELVCFADAQPVSAKGLVISFQAEGDLAALRETALRLDHRPTEIVAQGPKPAHFTLPDPDGIIVEFRV